MTLNEFKEFFKKNLWKINNDFKYALEYSVELVK